LDQVSVHGGEVTKIIVSPDNRFVFSAGSDGTLFIFQVSE
jgi:WD40 repeat protein